MISNNYVQTGLITGKDWDRTCNWIKEKNTNLSLTDSSSYGNYSTSTVEGHGIKQNAGYSDFWMTKNIYDLAGNVWEWSNESFPSNDSRMCRGGCYSDRGGSIPISYRDVSTPALAWDSVGFRVRLYIK